MIWVMSNNSSHSGFYLLLINTLHADIRPIIVDISPGLMGFKLLSAIKVKASKNSLANKRIFFFRIFLQWTVEHLQIEYFSGSFSKNY